MADADLTKALESFEAAIKHCDGAAELAKKSWQFLLTTMFSLYVAANFVSHADIALGTPIGVPSVGLGVDAGKFFAYSPMALCAIYFGAAMLHFALAAKLNSISRKLKILQEKEMERMSNDERTERCSSVYASVNAYHFCQLLSNPSLALPGRVLMRLMVYFVWFLGPLLVVLFLQATYLPAHDESILHWQRGACLLLVVLSATFYLLCHDDDATSFRECVIDCFKKWRCIVQMIAGAIFAVLVLGFSFLLLSTPAERDRHDDPIRGQIIGAVAEFSRSWSGALEQALQHRFCPLGIVKERSADMHKDCGWLGWLVDGAIDHVKGEYKSVIGRNLVVTDTNLREHWRIARGLERFRIDFSGSEERPPLQRPVDGGNTPSTARAGFSAAGSSMLNLRGRNFQYATFDRSTFDGIDLRCAVFWKASLFATQLLNVKLGYNFEEYRQREIMDLANPCLEMFGGQFGRAMFKDADFSNVTFRNSEMPGAVFSGARMKSVTFDNVKLNKEVPTNDNPPQKKYVDPASFEGATLNAVSFRNMNLSSVRFAGAVITSMTLDGEAAASMNLCGARMTNRPVIVASQSTNVHPAMAYMQLDSTEMEGAHLPGARMQGVRLKAGTNLARANMSGETRLQAAVMPASILRAADLSGAWLHGADLTGADLRGARLRGAKLVGANLRNARLSGADLSGADLSGADLSGVEDLQAANLAGAKLTHARPIPSTANFGAFMPAFSLDAYDEYGLMAALKDLDEVCPRQSAGTAGAARLSEAEEALEKLRDEARKTVENATRGLRGAISQAQRDAWSELQKRASSKGVYADQLSRLPCSEPGAGDNSAGVQIAEGVLKQVLDWSNRLQDGELARFQAPLRNVSMRCDAYITGKINSELIAVLNKP